MFQETSFDITILCFSTAVFGKGFMARDMAFINTAGPSKHQAVALMVSADLTAFYRCTMNAYQDTLYVHAQRQYYRDCTIIGTVNFIFGNAASVLQNSKFLPRRRDKRTQSQLMDVKIRTRTQGSRFTVAAYIL